MPRNSPRPGSRSNTGSSNNDPCALGSSACSHRSRVTPQRYTNIRMGWPPTALGWRHPPLRTPLGRVERFADVDRLAHDLAVPDLEDVDSVARFTALIPDGHLRDPD